MSATLAMLATHAMRAALVTGRLPRWRRLAEGMTAEEHVAAEKLADSPSMTLASPRALAPPGWEAGGASRCCGSLRVSEEPSALSGAL